MQATLPMPVQTATLAACNGNVKLVRNGQTIACEPGMQLLPGDRLIAGNSGHAEVQFTGVTEHVVIEHGSAATMALQTVQLDQPAQWVVIDLEGAHVFMEDATHTAHTAHAKQHATEHASLQGLVGEPGEHSSATATPADTSSHHWGDALLGLGAAAFVAADSGGSSSSASADPTLSPAGNDAAGSNSAQPAPQPAPQPDPSGGVPSNGGTSSGGNALTDLLHLQQSPGVSSTASHNANLNDLLHSLLGQHTQA